MNKKHGLIVLLFLVITIPTIAHPGVGIVMDGKGNVYYTDLKHIWKIDAYGKVSIAVRNVHSHEIYLDEKDNLYGEHLWYEGEATDKWGHYVWRLSSAGKLERITPPTEGFLTDYSFVRDPQHHMFWADRTSICQKIIRKNSDNTVEKIGNQCLSDVRCMTVTPQGGLYFIDRHDLKKIDTHGHTQTLATNLHERKLSQFAVNDPHLTMGLWTDKKENVYVAIYGARKVKKIAPDKKISVVAETATMWSPTGGFIAPNGDFWLLEYSITNQVRVERITTDGKRTIYPAQQ